MENGSKFTIEFEKINLQIPIIGWDLKVKNLKGEIWEVDVKSSGPDSRASDLSFVLTRRNLATKPSTISGTKITSRGEERDVNIQVYHLPEDDRHTYLISWALLEDLIVLAPIPEYQRTIGQYSYANTKPRYDTILNTLRTMESLLPLLK